jgi:type IV pilus assembly protein PilN
MLEINLLPVREVRKRAEARQSLLQLALVILLTVSGMGVLHSRLRAERERVQARIQQMEKDIANFKPQLDQVEAFKKKKSELEKKIDVIDGLDRQRRGPVRVMAELADRIPERVWLTSLDTSGGTIKLQGESLDNELVALFLRDLGGSSYFADVDLEGTKLSAEKGGLKLVRFDVKASLAGPKAAPLPGEGKPAAAGPRPAGNRG